MYGGDQLSFGGPAPYAGPQEPQYMGGVAPNGYAPNGGMMAMRKRQPRGVQGLGKFTPYMEAANPFAGVE